MELNNKNNTKHYKVKTRLFRGKTKHILILIPAILLLTCTLALPMASGQVQATALLPSNSINSNGVISNGGISVNTPLITTLTSSSSGGMTLIGNMTVIGDSLLNGSLALTDAEQVILGSPLMTAGTLNIAGDSIEIGKPCYEGGTIILMGEESNPSIVNLSGNIFIGNQAGAKEIFMNMTNFYQYVNSNGTGYIGDSGSSNHLPLNTLDAIKVTQGELHIYSTMRILGIPVSTSIRITNTTFRVVAAGFIPYSINLAPYGGVANVSYLKDSGAFTGIGWLLSLFISDVTDVRYLEWEEPTIFEAWGPWFALESGIISMTDTYVQMKSNDTMYYQFLDASTEAGFRVLPSAHYPKAGMNVTTQEQNIAGLGFTYITNGSMFLDGVSIIEQQNQITNGILEFEGEMLLDGDINAQGDIGVSGYSKMLSPMTVTGSLNVNDGAMTGEVELTLVEGYMVTDGEMSIEDGEMNILQGIMEMNSTGIYIHDSSDTSIIGSITSTGIMEITGSSSITGDIGISGYNYMQGNVNIRAPLLSLEGVMVTDGDMSINNGEISIPSGSMVMNSTGSYITGDTITVMGEVDFNGDATITGDIGISGYNYMQGSVGVAQLSLDGVMVTDGDMSITSGEINILNGHMIMNDSGSFITGDTITVTGTVESSGDAVITGDIGISGYNYMQGLISIEGYLNINNGLTEGMLILSIDGTMETTGSMTITNGEINIPDGHMVMNDSGSFITGNTITVTGDQIVSLGTTEVNGDITIQGDIGISGYNYMQGNVNVAQLILDGVMATDGDMTITGGAISISNGHMVMNDTGSFITSTGNTITVTGIVSFNGDATITGDIELSGHNYMQGNVNVGQLSLNGVMVTDGDMSITSGEISILSGSMVLNSTGSFITGDTITVTGTINFNGDATITGDIELSGYNYMEGLITVQGDMNINNGLTTGEITLTIASTMETTGSMTITNGEINIPSVTMVLNSTGSFITGDTISVTGDQIASQGTTEVNGDITMTGDIGISGYSSMQGLISIEGYLNINNGLTTGTLTLSIDGTMETTGSMTITNGEISIPDGQIVMNDIGSFIIGDTITVTGDQINSVGTTEVNGDITMQGDYFEIGGESYIKGPVSVSGSLSINGGTMKGTGTIVVSDGFMQTVGTMKISNGVIEVLNGKIVMDPSGTHIGSETSIVGDLAVAGTVKNSGLITMSGTFQILTPLSITGSMVTMGITSMGDLGAINGILTITGNIIMSGMTVISGDNNVIGSMTVTPAGVAINGITGLTGVVHTTGGLPTMSSSTILEISSGSMMGVPIPHTALMANPLALLALGILGFGTVWVVFRSLYYGIKERRTLVPRIRRTGEFLRNSGSRFKEAVKRLSSEIGKRIKIGD